jgi:outer membrane receptor protein involved in Fe transport
MSIVDFKDYQNNPFNTEDYYFTVYAANPYYAFHESSNKYNEDRMFGNATMTYQFLPELKGTIRVGTDVSNSQSRSWEAINRFALDSWALNNPGSAKKGNPGYYSENFGMRREINADYLLAYEKKVTDAIGLNGLLGFNVNQRNGKSLNSYLSALDIPGFYNIGNSPNAAQTSTNEYKRRLYGVFGQVDFNFKDYWFVSVTARQDYSSTLPTDNNSFFYPGINTSFLISDAFPEVQSFLPYAKLRASWGRTGKDASEYQIATTFPKSSITNPYGNLNFPVQNVNGTNVIAFELSNQIGNSTLQPEISTEYEIGFDFRLFNNRFGVDFAYYNKQITDQILPVPLANSSGYSAQVMNFGKLENKGIELMFTIVPIKTRDFEWTGNVSYTRNRGKVLELAAGLDEIRFTGAYGVDYVALKGYPVGVFKGPVNVYDPQGRIVVGKDGYPVASTEKGIYGNSEAKFNLGIINTFKYKDFTLGFTIDVRQGGIMYSGIADLQYFVGNAVQTTFNDRQPFIIPNSVEGYQSPFGDWTYTENTTAIDMSGYGSYYYPTKNKVADRQRIIDKSYTKLREVTLTYTVPKKYLGKLPVGGLSVSAYGKNLLIWTPAENNFIDPEVTSFGNDLAGDFGEFRTNPTLRTFGFSVKATF